MENKVFIYKFYAKNVGLFDIYVISAKDRLEADGLLDERLRKGITLNPDQNEIFSDDNRTLVQIYEEEMENGIIRISPR